MVGAFAEKGGGVVHEEGPGGASQKRKITDLIGRLPRPGKAV